ncbi:MAG TPA: NAD(P)H-dependent oxidoreductase, partial [Methanomicrobiales archaeon]|nr:NAD(P)H-dependent oxidoreductase [Methanomicrobiales archaeon]
MEGPIPSTILGIQGSPRGMHSRTRKLVSWTLQGAEDAGATVDLIDLTLLRIEPCTA